MKPNTGKAMIDCEYLPQVVTELGSEKFAGRLMEFLASELDAAHLSVFAFDHRFAPRQLIAESADGQSIAAIAGEKYISTLAYRHDPNLGQCRANEKGTTLLRMQRDDIQNLDYRRDIYEKFDLVDRLSILDYLSFGWCAVNIYRSQQRGPFEPELVEKIERMAALILALTDKHAQLCAYGSDNNPEPGDTAYFESLLNAMGQGLSQREVEVCARALRGMTGNGIALDLEIGYNTVVTLRKRAYSKLNIASLNELFALCLARASQ